MCHLHKTTTICRATNHRGVRRRATAIFPVALRHLSDPAGDRRGQEHIRPRAREQQRRTHRSGANLTLHMSINPWVALAWEPGLTRSPAASESGGLSITAV